VAYWADWRFLGLSKEQWGAIHINTGFLFLMSLSLHIYYNWNPIVAYLKNRKQRIRIFTKEFNAALVILLLFIFGTGFEMPPFSTILAVSDAVKDRAAVTYGEPPYGHAELSSLKTFTKKMGLDDSRGRALLEQAGYRVENENQTLKQIARTNDISPQKVYQTLMPAAQNASPSAGKAKQLPESPVPGTGNSTLADLCSQYNLNMKVIVRALSEQNISASEDMTLKKIAEQNNTGSSDIYEAIKSAVQNTIAE